MTKPLKTKLYNGLELFLEFLFVLGPLFLIIAYNRPDSLFRLLAISTIAFLSEYAVLLKKKKMDQNWTIKVILIAGLVIGTVLFALTTNGGGKGQEPTNKEEYIIVLGAGIKGEEITPMLQNRLDKALSIRKNIPIIVTGGQGPDEDITEAHAMKRYLMEKGIDENRILMEDKSGNTRQNLQFAKKLIIETNERPFLNIYLVTSDFHMYRAQNIAKDEGFIAAPLTAPVELKKRLIAHPREMLSIVKYWLQKAFVY